EHLGVHVVEDVVAEPEAHPRARREPRRRTAEVREERTTDGDEARRVEVEEVVRPHVEGDVEAALDLSDLRDAGVALDLFAFLRRVASRLNSLCARRR